MSENIPFNNSIFFKEFNKDIYLKKIKETNINENELNELENKDKNKIFHYFKQNFIKNQIHGYENNELFEKFKKCIENLNNFDNETYFNNYFELFTEWKWSNDTFKLKQHYVNHGFHNNKNCIKKENKSKDKIIYINTHSNLNNQAGDVIMISNMINNYINNGYNIELSSYYSVTNNFLQNIENKTKLKYYEKQNNENIINYLDNNYNNFEFIFFRNNDILDLIENKLWLDKCILYGLDIHLNNIKKLNENYKEVWTQSDKLKQLYLDNGINDNKIVIKEPLAYKYNFDLPERNDNEIRLIYCGTLRDEENILEIIEEFQKIHKERPEILLKIVYGKIHGNDSFSKQVNEYVKNGVKGITFKHNLSHKDACYEIATSDIGICWRKNGWGDNGEVSTKIKEYDIYGLNIESGNISKCNISKCNILKYDISLICCTKRPSFHYNILNSVKNLQDNGYNIKLLICLNNKDLDENKYKQYFDDNNIDNIIINSNKSLGECLNLLISKSTSDYIFKIDDDDIYLSGLINNCLPYLYNNSIISTSKKYIYCPEKDTFYIRENNIGYGSLLIFNKNKVSKFDNVDNGEDTNFLNKNKVKLLDLSNYHIHIRHTDSQFHTDKDKNYFDSLKLTEVNKNFKNIVKEFGIYEIEDCTTKKIKITTQHLYETNFNIKKLNIIGIFDEFLYNTFKSIFNINLISPNDEILNNYSFFFCESCWNGNNGKWKYKINTKKVKNEVINILNQCKKLNIPTIFYNKEDPVNFDSYIETAKHFDIIVTTDINCLNKYKDLTKAKIFVMPFNINPLTINNIGRCNDNDESFFAGSYTYNLSDERKKNTIILLDELKKKKNMILFDRCLNAETRKQFYRNKYTLNMFHPKYNKYIHKAITHEELLNIHKIKNWCGNLNTVKNSDTMFARRVLEGCIMKNSLVTDYSQGVYKNFKNSIYKLEDKLKYDNNEDILLNQIKKQLGWRNVIENYNSYKHFSKLFNANNITGFESPFEIKKKISVICSTNRIDNYSIILDNFNRQKYDNKELIIIFNLDMNSKIQNIINNNKNSNIKIKQIDEKETLGYCLNKSIELSNGDIISKFDDDDYYGEYYLLDMYLSMIISNADLVGKCAHMVYALETNELWVKFYKINYENYTYQAKKWNFICGGSLFFKKTIYEKCKFKESNTGEDSNFIEQVKNNNFTIYASDFFNYCYIRNTPENHTFKTDLKTFLGSKSIMINKYDKIPINLINI